MAPQITGGLGISRIQKPMYRVCPAMTLGRRTLKDVGLPILDVLNGWKGFEEDIYWCIPVLSKSF